MKPLKLSKILEDIFFTIRSYRMNIGEPVYLYATDKIYDAIKNIPIGIKIARFTTKKSKESMTKIKLSDGSIHKVERYLVIDRVNDGRPDRVWNGLYAEWDYDLSKIVSE